MLSCVLAQKNGKLSVRFLYRESNSASKTALVSDIEIRQQVCYPECYPELLSVGLFQFLKKRGGFIPKRNTESIDAGNPNAISTFGYERRHGNYQHRPRQHSTNDSNDTLHTRPRESRSHRLIETANDTATATDRNRQHPH